MEKQGSIYKYHVYKGHPEGWVYEIYTQFDDVLIRESEEWFDSKGRATLAAIGHISLLENGEG